MMAASQENYSLLEQTTVGQLVQSKGRLVEVPYTATVGDTLNALLAHHIVAVPVAAPPGQWIGAGGSMIVESDRVTGMARKHYIGMVSVFDILIHVTEDQEMPDVESRLSVPVATAIGHSLESLSLWTISPTTSLLTAMEPMGKGIHRALVPVISRLDHVSGVELTEMSPGYHMLSQTDVVRFLSEHNEALNSILTSHSISDLGALQHSVFAIPASMTVINAAKCMRNAQLTAVAIVDPQEDANQDPTLIIAHGKRIVSTFSATDLRGCGPDALRLWSSMSVLEFLGRSRVAMQYGVGAAAEERNPSAIVRPPVTCLLSSSVREVMSKALENKVHRVWVTDEEQRLLGVSTFSDLIRSLHDLIKPPRYRQ